MRSGILAGGNWIRDHVKTVDAWPAQDSLANILGHTEANGGGPYNVLKDLAKMGARFPLTGIGLIGDDADGHAVLADCRASGIETRLIRSVPGLRTGSTDVMTVQSTGRRTFFHDRGANAELAPPEFDFAGRTDKVFYLGYLLLLDGLDASAADGTPHALDVLRRARQAGMITAVDCVSAPSERFRVTVSAVLPEVDILFANDFEAEQITGIGLGRGSALDRNGVEMAARALVELGVHSWAIIHFPEGACACSGAGEIVWQPAVRMSSEKIAGTVGAGDALAAGVLLGVHEGWQISSALELGVCAAAASLRHPTCSESVPSLAECLEFGREQGYLIPA